jgi:hypothetical protein
MSGRTLILIAMLSSLALCAAQPLVAMVCCWRGLR